MKKISILGSTGSIGTQTLDVISHYPEQYTVEGLSGGHNIKLLAEQIRQFRPRKASVATKELAEQLSLEIPSDVKVYYGEEGLIEIAAGTDAEFVVTAVVGSQGLAPTIAAIEAGKQIGLANKETLVSAGHLVTGLANRRGVRLLPIDSEHSAIFQCLQGERQEQIHTITLTASGGSFRDRTRDELKHVTVEDALKHPNWAMGAKITIDSATMVNKGLEVIEAHWLFDLSYDQIEVLIHPESIIHSFVEFKDYSVIAQMGLPDMRVPIQYALTYPNRMKTPAGRLRLKDIGRLHFREMDFSRYPCLRMAFESGRIGGSMPTVYNAANEVAVERFLKGEISFLDIERVIEQVMAEHEPVAFPDLPAIFEIDKWARLAARNVMPQL
ncbi:MULTISPECIES: 1-deoxy-D-xylulose-5-phosphate reductoisomerase [Paenibacillus]|uniref:1-deoxy-D-xylulose 5-phosphate reductoisomerase n=1 Tax=Paenibacillus naphthalenovorans TaxID=162209 RepID=A0A0U2VQ82_9BACL|nr:MULTISPECIES: 1-deoxy-D-xylulose-5-phosphate reductoisomerase [Paenibacillus]ALS21671.1 1-deoxy-D-xylulose 5-phosphate reductoisomerase [Paenibacillus naphthalenovorans]NTZ18175.1 1-deoxy-D-xylulose-5-phosphate reductoisomerase [Paenibacillus sp. JMULE4]GCL71399.1 1-deoxy-D-xylulose-5-phosphate reductoisomerase [Paenibacillus naphthalenovorans]SDI88235.1 1-deoxy-D-xylulose-5-phosphate reductoisomerase [Paenibacillus naphthalenovorans]